MGDRRKIVFLLAAVLACASGCPVEDDCGQEGEPLQPLSVSVLNPLEGCPVPFLDRYVDEQVACLGTVGGWADVTVTIDGFAHSFSATRFCAVTPICFHDMAMTHAFSGFIVAFASETLDEYVLLWIEDADRLGEAHSLTLADPLCESGSAWRVARFLPYVVMNGQCYVPGDVSKARVSFSRFVQGFPALGDRMTGEMCASLQALNDRDSFVDISGTFDLVVGDGVMMGEWQTWAELCPEE